MSKYTESFRELAARLAGIEGEFPNLRGVALAQWILESGRGKSRLARDHLNFGGLKWREEMAGLAEPVEYEAHDGTSRYCKFASLDDYIRGYWLFLDRPPYRGWREHAGSPENFINFIGPIYTPTDLYADTVMSLLPEAMTLLAEASGGAGWKAPGTGEPLKPAAEWIRSPNCSSRQGVLITRIIMHYTTVHSIQSTINHFKNPASQVSAHYVIGRDGRIVQMVRDGDKAWHTKGANRDSIGIEHAAEPGDLLTDAQGRASAALLRWLLAEYKLPRSSITGHRYAPDALTETDCPSGLFGDPTENALQKWVQTYV